MRMNCVQLRQSIRPNAIVPCLGANVKKYAACEDCIDHSCHPRLCEFLFEVANALLTVPRAIGNVAGNPISLQFKTTEHKLKEARQLTGRTLITMTFMHKRTSQHHELLSHSFPAQDLPKIYR